MQEPKTVKAERTRKRILETALGLFRERGYDDTTMRAIAGAADVSLGNAYYYFKSKEHLIQAFYARSHEEHLEASRPVLERERQLRARLSGVMRAKLDTIEPYHRFAGVLFKTAADPRSPLNPFSAESREVRRQSTDLFDEVVTGSELKLPKKLKSRLPDLLWTYHMGVILFWIHDDSPGRARSYRLVDRSVDLVVSLIKVARLPLMRPVLGRAFKLFDELAGPLPSRPEGDG